MRDYSYLTSFDGVPVIQFEHAEQAPPAHGEFAWAVRTEEYEGEEFGLVFERFLATVDPATVTRLVIGCWGEHYEVAADVPRDLLVEAAPRLPSLKALFFGDIVMEEAEISWIQQCDLTPLLNAYPGLERLEVRGGTHLRMAPLSSTTLRALRFESGNLPAEVARAVGASDLPALETLDLWLGAAEYGGDTALSDLAGILIGDRLPALRRLGLMDSEIQDEICGAVAMAPVVARLSELDLSMGVLTDDGAEALLTGQPLTHLRTLNLEHHYMTGPMVARLRAAFPGTEVLIDDAQPNEDEDGEQWRYVAVSE